MGKFRNRLLGEQETSHLSVPLTPLAERLCAGLRTIADTDPRLGMILTGFEKHLRRSPVPDKDIRDALEWGQALLTQILGDDDTDTSLPESAPVPASALEPITGSVTVETPLDLEPFTPVPDEVPSA